MRATDPQPGHRLNVLLTEADQRWADQLPRLLEPQGVRAICVDDMEQALAAIDRERIHAAVVNLDLPMTPTKGQSAGHETGGLKLLRVIRRLEPAPPTVVVRPRRFDARADNRMLSEALRLQAFSVLDLPVELEQLLEVLAPAAQAAKPNTATSGNCVRTPAPTSGARC